MIVFTQFADIPKSNDLVEHVNIVALPFDRRQRSRMQVNIERGPLAGTAVGIQLPRGTVLRHGQMLAGPDGQLLRIDAANEPLLLVRAASAHKLATLAYHLGNRHVPVQIADDSLRLGSDSVLANMIRGLGGDVCEVTEPFDPEDGAYRSSAEQSGHHHSHSHGHHHHQDKNHAPRIHDLAVGR